MTDSESFCLPSENTEAVVASPAQGVMNLLDMGERWLLLIFLTQMVGRLGWSFYATGDISALLTIPGETLVIILLLLRRPAIHISTRPSDWGVAFAGTILPTLVVAQADISRLLWPVVGLFFAAVGLIIQVHAKISLGRSFGMVAANRGIRRVGPYRFVRHPMYTGYLVGHLAFLGLYPSLWNIFVLGAAAAFQVSRLFREERILSQDAEYLQYLQTVRYRLIPGLF